MEGQQRRDIIIFSSVCFGWPPSHWLIALATDGLAKWLGLPYWWWQGQYAEPCVVCAKALRAASDEMEEALLSLFIIIFITPRRRGCTCNFLAVVGCTSIVSSVHIYFCLYMFCFMLCV